MNTVISFETKVTCNNCSLGDLCLAHGLSSEDMEKLEQIVKRNRPLHRNDLLFQENTHFKSLYIINTGSIKTFIPTEEGGEQVLGFHLPGEFIGFEAIQAGRHTCSAKVLETSAVCELPFDEVSSLSRTIPELQQQIFKLLSKEIADESKMLALLSRKNAEERLASFLAGLSCRFQYRGFSPTEFNLSMSRHEIGSYLGLAVETISRLLTQFQERGLLRVQRKHVELLDIEQLHLIAGNDTRGRRKKQGAK